MISVLTLLVFYSSLVSSKGGTSACFLEVTEGHPARLTFPFDYRTLSGNPDILITRTRTDVGPEDDLGSCHWFTSGLRCNTRPSISILGQEQTDNFTISIPVVSSNMSGKYFAKVTDSIHGFSSSCDLSVREAPRDKQPGAKQTTPTIRCDCEQKEKDATPSFHQLRSETSSTPTNIGYVGGMLIGIFLVLVAQVLLGIFKVCFRWHVTSTSPSTNGAPQSAPNSAENQEQSNPAATSRGNSPASAVNEQLPLQQLSSESGPSEDDRLLNKQENNDYDS